MSGNDLSKAAKFIKRLYRETSDPSNQYITWSDDGERIRIIDKEGFVKHILPSLSKTKEYSGFIRQLNIYGFVKAKGDRNDDIEEYYSSFFKRDKPGLIAFMKRDSKTKKLDNKIDQTSMENTINYLTTNNYKLSNEISQLKDRLEKQEITLNGILDILGRVFRTGAQNMGYDVAPKISEIEPLFGLTMGSRKTDTILRIKEKEEEEEKQKKENLDMSSLFF